MSTRTRLLLTAGSVCCVLVGFAILGILRSQRVADSADSTTSSGLPSIGGPFQLIDKEGKLWKDTDFRGKPFLIYFGYTYCPDICPTALYTMSQAVDKLGGSRVIQPLFITIDPERDTPAQLQNYTQKFLKDFILLTGPKTEIKRAIDAYRVHAARVYEGEGVDRTLKDKKNPKLRSQDQGQNKADDTYLIDHSSLIYLMGKNGEYIAHFNHQSAPSEIITRVTEYLKTGR